MRQSSSSSSKRNRRSGEPASSSAARRARRTASSRRCSRRRSSADSCAPFHGCFERGDLKVSDALGLACVPNAILLHHEQRKCKHESDRDQSAEGNRERVLAHQPAQQLPGGVVVRANQLSSLKSPQVRGHLESGRITIRRLPRHGLLDDRHEVDRQARRQIGAVGSGGSASTSASTRAGFLSGIRAAACQQVVQHGAEGVDVGARIDRRARRLLRGI